MNKAVEWKWLPHRPAIIRRLKEDQGRIRYLTIAECARLKGAAKLDLNLLTYPFVVVGLETGMRRMEIFSIRKEHVDLGRRIIFVPNAKAGPREQPMTDNLSAYLSEYIKTLSEDNPWLFPSPTSQTGHLADIRKAFRRAVIAAGMNPDEVLRHTLRHTAITHLVQSGVDLPTVKRISGHKTLIMVERYSHQNGEHIRSAMNKLEGRYQESDANPVAVTQELHEQKLT